MVHLALQDYFKDVPFQHLIVLKIILQENAPELFLGTLHFKTLMLETTFSLGHRHVFTLTSPTIPCPPPQTGVRIPVDFF